MHCVRVDGAGMCVVYVLMERACALCTCWWSGHVHCVRAGGGCIMVSGCTQFLKFASKVGDNGV